MGLTDKRCTSCGNYIPDDEPLVLIDNMYMCTKCRERLTSQETPDEDGYFNEEITLEEFAEGFEDDYVAVADDDEGEPVEMIGPVPIESDEDDGSEDDSEDDSEDEPEPRKDNRIYLVEKPREEPNDAPHVVDVCMTREDAQRILDGNPEKGYTIREMDPTASVPTQEPEPESLPEPKVTPKPFHEPVPEKKRMLKRRREKPKREPKSEEEDLDPDAFKARWKRAMLMWFHGHVILRTISRDSKTGDFIRTSELIPYSELPDDAVQCTGEKHVYCVDRIKDSQWYYDTHGGPTDCYEA